MTLDTLIESYVMNSVIIARFAPIEKEADRVLPNFIATLQTIIESESQSLASHVVDPICAI